MITPIKQFFDEIIKDTSGIGVNVWGNKNASRSLWNHNDSLSRKQRHHINKKFNKITQF
jgi:hypothetical protein